MGGVIPAYRGFLWKFAMIKKLTAYAALLAVAGAVVAVLWMAFTHPGANSTAAPGANATKEPFQLAPRYSELLYLRSQRGLTPEEEEELRIIREIIRVEFIQRVRESEHKMETAGWQ